MGYGLLEEMSLFELRERLENIKSEKAKKIESKKIQIISQKDLKNEEIREKILKISKNRKEKFLEHQEKKIEKMRKIEEQKLKEKKIREEALIEVHSKIVDKKKKKRQEEDFLAKDLRIIKLKRQYLNANQVYIIIKILIHKTEN